MAFSKDQSRRARSVVVLVLLVAVVSFAAVVLFGGGPLGDASRDASSGSSVAASNAADGSVASSQAQQDGHTMADVDASYDAATKQLLAKYEANPSDPSTLLNVANGYFDWGATALSHAQGAEDEQHATDLFNQATHYYDEYLATYPGSKSAEVDRAVSMFYAGDHAKAIQTPETFVAQDDSFGPAWANLGMFYDADGRADDARTVYERAIEADADDAYGAKTYAQQRLDAMDSAAAGDAS